MRDSRLFKLDFDRAHFGDGGLESSSVGCAADTLYSALCSTALRMGGQPLLDELVASATLRLTDLLPYVGDRYLVPKPLRSIADESSSVQKKLAKKVGFVPVEQLADFLNGKADLEELAGLQSRIGVHAVAAKAAIHNGKDDAEPYRVTFFQFHDDAGLWLLATGAASELDLLGTLLRGLPALGGERTSGYGAFSLTQATVPAELATGTEAALLMTLTTALPADDELEAVLAGATYRLVKRSGFISSTTYAATPRRKRDLYKLAAGSVFTRPFDGVIADVGRGGGHPVYSYARPLFLPLPETAA
ncbi:CRISPR system Cms protein Csm4 [Mycobacterium heckeshornense]|uniref:type III-A CRISPR-associated RAMP protein Csm4 n=1 Tax=Mycobacterium heckeshornense TaxID=110505 RepID=UPI001941E45A|nr:type III-A CRISPR-associated RAMP protein Csm4 [Mycobacterium heckeshornense]BCQ10565.1 CRISPR system Cms protein Csm4 [Mycobacterium heckeshornense]